MYIGVDARFVQDPYSSIGVFQRNIIKHLLALDRNNYYHVFLTQQGERFVKTNDRTQFVPLKSTNLLLSNRTIAREAKKLNLELFFATFNISPKFSHKVRVVLQNHDFSYRVHDFTLQTLLPSRLYRYLQLRSVRHADFLLANSAFTKSQLERITLATPIRVIYHDCDPEFKQGNVDHETEERGSREVILYAGRVAPRYKNIGVLLRGFREYSKVYNETTLTIVHNDQVRPKDRSFAAREKLNATFLKNLERPALIRLYRTAAMSVYPSGYEGFGTPILEAQNSHCPLIINNAPPLPEVAGDGAIYYDGSAADLAKKMRELKEDPYLRERLVRKGFLNAGRFDWKITATETLECLNQFS